MLTRITHIRFTSHQVYISQDDKGRLFCFKSNECACDMAVFHNQHDAADYILEPLSYIHYRVTFEDDQDDWMPCIVRPGSNCID
jgi:hypothetical protein